MIMDDFFDDRIDKYLKGEMSAKESLLFEQEALNNSELRKEIELRYLIKRSLIDRQRKLHTTGQWESKKRNRLVKFATFFSIAAILVAAFLFIRPESSVDFLYNNTLVASVESDNQEQSSHQNQPACTTVNIKSSQVVAQVKKTISEGREEDAVATINQLERENVILTVSNITDRCLMTNQTMASEDVDLLNKNSYELQWLKILSLINIGRKKEAIASLKGFIIIDGIHQEKADSLLKTLDTE